jgi:PPM family protein phosphatase
MDQGDGDSTADLQPEAERIARFFLPSPPPVRVAFGAMSHPGKVRRRNEDHYLIVRLRRSLSVLRTNLPEGQLAPQADEDIYASLVADGIGGAADGERASTQAIRVAVDLMLQDVKWTMKFNPREEGELLEKIEMYIRLMDRALIDASRTEPRLAGMGTTLTAAATIGPVAFIVHAGDSRAYLFRAGALRRLTRDHTLAQDLVDSGLADPGSPEARRAGHVLTNYLGGPGDGGTAEIHRLTLADGDRLLLCTDGLTDLVDDEEIARVLDLLPEPDEACRALVESALAHGGRDNVTAVLGCYSIPAESQGRGAAGDPAESRAG